MLDCGSELCSLLQSQPGPRGPERSQKLCRWASSVNHHIDICIRTCDTASYHCIFIMVLIAGYSPLIACLLQVTKQTDEIKQIKFQHNKQNPNRSSYSSCTPFINISSRNSSGICWAMQAQVATSCRNTQ